ncbi:MAG: hypothetical protein ACLP9L_15565 [Thermoguttaceae bacterium]
MRLTLRTLLAYMDGLLDTKDSQEIGKKIEDSKFATELFHKVRDVMRRLRLAAPSITERGANLDCNTVAEYLDNALPSDRVPDFEEVSLKSEVHLAEVASCHQILTMVLGEPAEIDPESRQRMYQLPTVANRVDEERQAAVEAATMLSGDGNAVVPAVPPPKVRPRPVVPEYLRDPKKSRLLPAAAVMLLVGAAIGLLLLMLGQFNPGTPLGNSLRWVQAKMQGKTGDDEEQDEGDQTKSAKPVGESSARAKTAIESDGAAGSNGEAAPKSSNAAPATPANQSALLAAAKDSGNSLAAGKSAVPSMENPPKKSSAEKPAFAEGPPPATPGKAPVTTAVPGPEVGVPSLPPGTNGPPASVATAPQAPDTVPGVAETAPVTSVAGLDLAGHDLKGAEPKVLPGGPTVGSQPPKSPVEVARIYPPPKSNPGVTPPAGGTANHSPIVESKAKVGRYMSDGQDVLLKFEANNAGWRRVLPEEFLAGRQPLLALPSYRPRVGMLNVGATLELINGTRIELLPDSAQGQPGVDIDFGRVVIKPLAQAGARLRVVVGSHTGTITLTSVESIAGLEVTRVHDPGKDPEKGISSHALTRLYVARGSAVWEEGDGKQPVRLSAPAELMLDGASADTPLRAGKEVPKWITTNTINELDQRTGLSVSQALPADRAASLGLMELTEDRRKEVCGLAARCLGYLGQFDPMTAALNDLDYRSKWSDYIDQLKEAIARGPETAAGVRQSLEKQFGNDSASLYRMLWGYTNKDLENGEDARLVKFLDHEALVFRVLAIDNLREITHQGLFYRPEANAAKRLASVQQWQRQQQFGRIRFVLPDVKPRSAPVASPPKETIPEPPKPLELDLPADVKPTSVIEPAVSAPDTAAPTRLRGRTAIGFPESDPSAMRPRIVFPEPQPAN